MTDINSYTGKQYDFETYNCWSHVCAVRSDAGLQTRMFTASTPAIQDIAEAFNAAIEKGDHGMRQVKSPRNYDVVLAYQVFKGRPVWHAGVYYDGWVSHCHKPSGMVVFEPLSDMMQAFKGVEFWRG